MYQALQILGNGSATQRVPLRHPDETYVRRVEVEVLDLLDLESRRKAGARDKPTKQIALSPNRPEPLEFVAPVLGLLQTPKAVRDRPLGGRNVRVAGIDEGDIVQTVDSMASLEETVVRAVRVKPRGRLKRRMFVTPSKRGDRRRQQLAVVVDLSWTLQWPTPVCLALRLWRRA